MHFISLGCAKNVVNCEQMMALCREKGYELLPAPEGAVSMGRLRYLPRSFGMMQKAHQLSQPSAIRR
mgnify:CR=1 FL=1